MLSVSCKRFLLIFRELLVTVEETLAATHCTPSPFLPNMDPLLLTVSITPLLGARGAIPKCTRKLAAAKHVPDILLQLENEVSSMQQIITATQDL